MGSMHMRQGYAFSCVGLCTYVCMGPKKLPVYLFDLCSVIRPCFIDYALIRAGAHNESAVRKVGVGIAHSFN